MRREALVKGEALAQISAALAASVLGQDPHAAAHTAQNAVSENAFVTVPIIIGAITLCEAYELYQTYEEHGPEAALHELIEIGAITLVTAGVGKVAYKVGAKLYPSAEAAFTAYKAQSPTLTKVVEKMSAGLKKSSKFIDKMTQLGRGKGPQTTTLTEKLSHLTEEDLIQKVANLADRKFPGKGPQVGTKKHQYAKKLMTQVQERKGLHPDIKLEKRYKGKKDYKTGMGTKDSVIPDVYNDITGQGYDYKFGGAKVTKRQRTRLQAEMPKEYKTVIEIKPTSTKINKN